ncbi:MAG: glycoside hydrolase family 88 protein [Nibricoccus sp.]
MDEETSSAFSVALTGSAVCDVAPIPALALNASSTADLVPLLAALQKHPVRSPAREELLRRQGRTPVDVARELSGRYGRQLDEITYIPAMALVGRLRLGELTGDTSHRRDVERLAEPYLSGKKPSLPAVSNGSQQAGHLLFGELAEITSDKRYVTLLRQAADLGFDAQGRPREVMPAHAEMSDAIFLGTPLLALTARLTGEAKYREVALRHLRTMVKLNVRPDGLHRHSPVAPDQTAWGRGNGFVAAGLALTLAEWPEEDAAFQELLALYRAHLAAMLPHQDALGMWHQVIDHPESYREYTVTCMTVFAIVRGLRRGWLDRATFEPVVQRAWSGILQRTAPGGGLVDVCAGTGKMKSLREYLDRPAILGPDDRGGAMALLVSTELAFAEREGKLSLQ